MLILAGDIGGTNSRLLLAEIKNGVTPRIVYRHSYASEQFASFNDVLEQLFADVDASPVLACFAVAGPVHADEARITNLPWVLNTKAISEQFKIRRVVLINDFQGAAYGIPALQDDERATLQTGEPIQDGVYAVLGAGTGFGQALAVPCENGYQAIACEAGHADFAPKLSLEIELLRWMQQMHARASYEQLLSGDGLLRIFEFLAQHFGVSAGDELRQAMQERDAAAAVSKAALANSDPLAVQALDLFALNLLSYAGNLALNCIPRAGIFIAGGIAPKILARLQQNDCLARFNDKPPMTELLKKIPVHVVLNDQVGLLGAMLRAAQLVTQSVDEL